MLKNKILFMVSLIIILGTGIFLFSFSYPRYYTHTLQGLQYQLGNQNKEFALPATIKVDGYLKRNLNGTKQFDGTIEIISNGIMLGNLIDVNIKFNKRGEGFTFFNSLGQNEIIAKSEIKIIFANNSISKITIPIIHQESKKPWTDVDGFMISAPANNRNEALLISNELIKDFLRGKSILELK